MREESPVVVCRKTVRFGNGGLPVGFRKEDEAMQVFDRPQVFNEFGREEIKQLRM